MTLPNPYQGIPASAMPAIVPQASQVSAAGGAASATLAGATGKSIQLGSINGSCSGAPAAGTALVINWSSGDDTTGASAGSESYFLAPSAGPFQVAFFPKNLPSGSSATITVQGTSSDTMTVYPEAALVQE